MNEALLQELLDAGTPPMLVVKVAAEMSRLAAEGEALERRRKADRERQQDRREVSRAGNVTSRDIADVADTADTPPSLDKEIPPRPPKEINPTPRATHASALARKASGFGPPDGVDLHTWNAFCSQRKKALSQIAYDRMLTTITESADVGWPPGELVERSIEKGWETLFTPSERRNGPQSGNHERQQSRSGNGFFNACVDMGRGRTG